MRRRDGNKYEENMEMAWPKWNLGQSRNFFNVFVKLAMRQFWNWWYGTVFYK